MLQSDFAARRSPLNENLLVSLILFFLLHPTIVFAQSPAILLSPPAAAQLFVAQERPRP